MTDSISKTGGAGMRSSSTCRTLLHVEKDGSRSPLLSASSSRGTRTSSRTPRRRLQQIGATTKKETKSLFVGLGLGTTARSSLAIASCCFIYLLTSTTVLLRTITTERSSLEQQQHDEHGGGKGGVNLANFVGSSSSTAAAHRPMLLEGAKMQLKISHPRSNNNNNPKPSPRIGACLLIMDDNHWLVEWLAYHERPLPVPIPLSENDRSVPNTWVLPNKLLHPTRNHDSVIIESNNGNSNSTATTTTTAAASSKFLLVNVLGRWNRHVEAINLLTGKQWAHRIRGKDPDGVQLNNLNHVYSVLVDSINVHPPRQDPQKQELWLPCGFHGDRVNRERSIHYARILDLDTLEIRTGPKLPYEGGACVALPLEIIPNEPPMICTFGGTIGRHDSGKFLPYSTCYDRVREKWWFPFGQLPMGLDHGSVALIPANTCQPMDSSRVLILNFRTESYGTQKGEILAYDLPNGGWTLDDLERQSINDRGSWYVYANVSYTGPEDVVHCPRDASGTLVTNKGRDILNFGGIFYDRPNGGFRTTRFSIVRSFNVCTKEWKAVGDLGAQIFALQTAASEALQVAITCGGEARHPKFSKMNSPWCFAHRL